MTSNISTVNINTNFPVQGKNNSSQGFRDNFRYITQALNIAANEISNLQSHPVGLVPATSSVLGGVKIGSGVNVAGDGTISVTPGAYTLPAATSSTLGGVKIGTGINLAGNGTISVNSYNLPVASSTILGGVKIGSGINLGGDGTISVSAGNYTLTTATSSVLGGVKIGSGINITSDGTISTSGGSLTSRITASTTTAVLSAGSTATTFVTGSKGYMLYKVITSTASWIRIYSNNAAQTSDSTRPINIDPLPGSGVIAEFLTTASGTVIVSPGVIGFNDETSPTTAIPISITNQSNSSAAITVSLVIVQLEA